MREGLRFACRDEACSLRVVPVGKSRREVFCPVCEAEECLFGGSVAERRGEQVAEWLSAQAFASRMQISVRRIYWYLRQGMPGEKRPVSGNGQRMMWFVEAGVAREWMFERRLVDSVVKEQGEQDLQD